MLVLSRRPGESIMIGHEVVLTVLEVRGDVVRIGIKAPRDLDVHREEVFLELQQANRSAASPSATGLDTLLASGVTGLASGVTGLASGVTGSASAAAGGKPGTTAAADSE